MLCTELREITASGITLSEGLELIAEQEKDGVLKSALTSAGESTASGGALAPALRETGLFPEHMLRMVAVAEETGALERVLGELAEHYLRQARLRRAVSSAVGYPLMLTVVVLAVFFVFLTEVLPVFRRVFDQIGASMSPLASAFLGFGVWLSAAKWWLLGVLAAVAAAVIVIRLVPRWREAASSLLSRVFGRGSAGRAVAQARLASVLSLAFSGTADINEALSLALEFSGGGQGEDTLRAVGDRVERGESFAAAALEEGLLSPEYCRMLAIGERTGSTERMISEVASRAQDDMETAIDRLIGRVEPAAVAVLSLLVGLLLLSVMLPLMGIMSAL